MPHLHTPEEIAQIKKKRLEFWLSKPKPTLEQVLAQAERFRGGPLVPDSQWLPNYYGDLVSNPSLEKLLEQYPKEDKKVALMI